ncbi:MAG: flagellar basal body rod protein FlgC [Desulfobacterota bacterium]|nr:flagellar basal body rod protein FlgC [Thermodesulfobacteriota bacterium]MDW8002791.1 flagellar basal body rod protein FlgC [Deltaproteobacteria bacterium]
MASFDALKISASALSAQKIRMEIISSNLANIHTTKTEDGDPYRKKEVIFEPVDFKNTLQGKLQGVKVQEVVESNDPFNKVYDPSHPHADSDGYVNYPNVNIIEEMVDMVDASRSYEANLAVLNITKEMIIKTLEIVK